MTDVSKLPIEQSDILVSDDEEDDEEEDDTNPENKGKILIFPSTS